jgi:hypothetical protein
MALAVPALSSPASAGTGLTGTATAYAAKIDAGFTGVQAFTHSGDQTSAGAAYCDDKIFSSYVSIDLAFSDGTYLSQLGAVDQNGFGLTAAQGEIHVFAVGLGSPSASLSAPPLAG